MCGLPTLSATALAPYVLLPFLLTVSISFSDEAALREHGYSLIPPAFSLEGYSYLMKNSAQIIRSYGVTIFVTLSGTILGLFIMTLFAYVVSRRYFPWRRSFTFVALFTMLFSGGMLPSYIINSHFLHLKDNILALILPVLYERDVCADPAHVHGYFYPRFGSGIG